MHEINLLDISSDKNFWLQLFAVVNRDYQIDWIKYKNKNYFNCENTWYDAEEILEKMKEKNILPAHINHECCEYDECENKFKYNKTNTNISDIEYVFSGSIDLEDLADRVDDKHDNNNKNINPESNYKINKIILMISKLKLEPKEIKFISEFNIKIVNKCGFNHDHKGSNHTLLKLPWIDEVNLGKEFTFFDLLSANYNLKSHKFDKWYELYCDVSCEKLNDLVIISLNFNHGS